MRKLIINRGLPGSGKSTAARNMVEEYKGTSSIRSTDDQFLVNGVYTFNPKMLGVNHNRNINLVENDMIEGIELIIVDNTNIRRRDFAAYITLANRYKYDITETVVGEFTPEFIQTCFKRNAHNVPLEAILRMAANFEV